MKIDEFHISKECLSQLQALGFTTVEEVTEYLKQLAIGIGTVSGKWAANCFYEVKDELKLLNLWTQELEQFWPSMV